MNHSISGFILFILFVVFFVVVPVLLGSFWAGSRARSIDRQNPLHIFTLLILMFVGVIGAAVLVQSGVLSGRYVY